MRSGLPVMASHAAGLPAMANHAAGHSRRHRLFSDVSRQGEIPKVIIPSSVPYIIFSVIFGVIVGFAVALQRLDHLTSITLIVLINVAAFMIFHGVRNLLHKPPYPDILDYSSDNGRSSNAKRD